jgi:hypothetical protein
MTVMAVIDNFCTNIWQIAPQLLALLMNCSSTLLSSHDMTACKQVLERAFVLNNKEKHKSYLSGARGKLCQRNRYFIIKKKVDYCFKYLCSSIQYYV